MKLAHARFELGMLMLIDDEDAPFERHAGGVWSTTVEDRSFDDVMDDWYPKLREVMQTLNDLLPVSQVTG